MAIRLKPRQEKFVQGLVAGKSEAAAYAAAGYKHSRANANKLRQRENVSRRLEELLDQRLEREEVSTQMALERARVSKQMIVEELKIIAFTRMTDFGYVDDTSGKFVLDLTKCPNQNKLGAIKEFIVDERVERDGDGKEDSVVRRTRFTLHDKKGALVDLARMHGMVNEHREGGNTLIQINMTEDELHG